MFLQVFMSGEKHLRGNCSAKVSFGVNMSNYFVRWIVLTLYFRVMLLLQREREEESHRERLERELDVTVQCCERKKE